VLYRHGTYVKVFEDPNVATLRVPTPNELGMVLDSLVASRALLMEVGAAALRKAEGKRRVLPRPDLETLSVCLPLAFPVPPEVPQENGRGIEGPGIHLEDEARLRVSWRCC
jgi:hypothetical protein